MRMRRWARAWFLFGIIGAGIPLARAAAPNHYIVLIDASRSVSAPGFSSLVERQIERRLLNGRAFGDNIPGYVRGTDYLTVFHFGIGTLPDSRQAFKYLNQWSVLDRYLDPKLLWQRNPSREDIDRAVHPRALYNLGILSWARALSLDRIRRTRDGRDAQRTFLILATDGEANGTSLMEEAENLETFVSDRERPKIQGIRQEFSQRFRLTDGTGLDGYGWKYPAHNDGRTKHFFATAHEVVPEWRVRRDDKFAELSAFDPVEGDWRSNLGHEWVRGELHPTAELRDWLKGGELLTVSHGSEVSSLDGAFTIPFPKGTPNRPIERRENIAVTVRDHDDWLGNRTKTYMARVPVLVPLSPSHTVGARTRNAFLILLWPALLAGLAYLAALRWFVSPVRILLPGRTEPRDLPTPRDPVARTIHAVLAAHPGQRAFTVVLPPWPARPLVLRNAVLRIETPEGTAVTFENGETELPLATAKRRIVANWGALAQPDPTLTVSLHQDDAIRTAVLDYPKAHAAPMPDTTEIVHYIALDLGSESMAAYHERQTREPELLDLQQSAELFMPGGVRPHLLTDAGKPSKRLPSRMRLRNNQPGPGLVDAHARLEFFNEHRTAVTGYGMSLFEIFRPEGELVDLNRAMPNPKVLFQYGAKEVLPQVRTTANLPLRLEPEALIVHLTSQIIRNFILAHPSLEGADPRTVDLTLTVPNVYSVTHSERLRQAVVNLCGLPNDRVHTISESDALAYYYLGNRTVKLDVEGNAERTEEDVLTIDVGRGTTDLSLIRLSRGSGQVRASMRGRTGRNTGGGHLTYLFVRFFDHRVERVFNNLKGETGLDSAPASFTHTKSEVIGGDPEFFRMILAVENLVEKIKRNVSPDYRVTLPPEAVEDQDVIVKCLIALAERRLGTSMEFLTKERLEKDLREALSLNHTLPSKELVRVSASLPKPKALFAEKFRRIKAEVTGRAQAWAEEAEVETTQLDDRDLYCATNEREELSWLGREIRAYVDQNVRETLIDLGRMVAEDFQKEKIDAARSPEESLRLALRLLVDPETTYVVVGGQGAQFRPIKAELERLFKRTTGVRPLAYVHYEGAMAKEACARGGVLFAKSRNQPENTDALYGTYGFVAQNLGALRLLNTTKLNSEGEDQVSFTDAEGHFLFYAPRLLGGKQGIDFNDPSIIRMGDFYGAMYDTRFERQDEEDAVRRLTINGAPVTLVTFGDRPERIWPKVWPEQLPVNDPNVPQNLR